MILVDSNNDSNVLSLPQSGVVVVGVELPDGLDLGILEKELRQFYGDRYSLVSHPPADIKPSSMDEPKPTSSRHRKKTVKAE